MIAENSFRSLFIATIVALSSRPSLCLIYERNTYPFRFFSSAAFLVELKISLDESNIGSNGKSSVNPEKFVSEKPETIQSERTASFNEAVTIGLINRSPVPNLRQEEDKRMHDKWRHGSLVGIIGIHYTPSASKLPCTYQFANVGECSVREIMSPRL